MKKWKRDSRRVRGDGDEMRKRDRESERDREREREREREKEREKERERETRREMINGRDDKKRRLDGV